MQQQVDRAQAELRMYKVQYDNAQLQIQRANDMIAESDTERDKAVKQMEKMRETLEKYKEAERLRRAREEGWKAGREEGYRTAQIESARVLEAAEEEWEDVLNERLRHRRRRASKSTHRASVDQTRSGAVVQPIPATVLSQSAPTPTSGPQPLTTENVEAFSTPRSVAPSREEFPIPEVQPMSDILVHPSPLAQPQQVPQGRSSPAVPIPPPSESHIVMPTPRHHQPDHIIIRSPLDATPVFPNARPLSRASTIQARSARQSIPPHPQQVDSK